MMIASSTAVRNADVVFRHLGTASILVHLKTNQIFELNETGARVWDLLAAGQVTVADLATSLSEEFEVEVREAEVQVAGLLQRFESQGLVRLV